jgi:hypothetical protein
MLQSRSRKEPHHFGGAGAVTRCNSGSKRNEHEITFVCIKQVGLLTSSSGNVGAKAGAPGAGAASKFSPGAGAA